MICAKGKQKITLPTVVFIFYFLLSTGFVKERNFSTTKYTQMKKYCILFAFLFCLTGSLLAQPAPMTKKMVKVELMKTLKELNLAELQDLYTTATQKEVGDLSKKALLKGIKKELKIIPLDNQINLLNYAKDVAQNGVPRKIPVVAPIPKDMPEPPVFQGPITVITFEHLEFDFGTIEQGEKVTHTFKFKNTGTESLLIFEARGSCGCTVPELSLIHI